MENKKAFKQKKKKREKNSITRIASPRPSIFALLSCRTDCSSSEALRSIHSEVLLSGEQDDAGNDNAQHIISKIDKQKRPGTLRPEVVMRRRQNHERDDPGSLKVPTERCRTSSRHDDEHPQCSKERADETCPNARAKAEGGAEELVVELRKAPVHCSEVTPRLGEPAVEVRGSEAVLHKGCKDEADPNFLAVEKPA